MFGMKVVSIHAWHEICHLLLSDGNEYHKSGKAGFNWHGWSHQLDFFDLLPADTPVWKILCGGFMIIACSSFSETYYGVRVEFHLYIH